MYVLFTTEFQKRPPYSTKPQNNIIDNTVPILLCLCHAVQSLKIYHEMDFEAVFLHALALMVLTFFCLV
jgi:hypothetical protein